MPALGFVSVARFNWRTTLLGWALGTLFTVAQGYDTETKKFSVKWPDALIGAGIGVLGSAVKDGANTGLPPAAPAPRG